jgi:hypothetical protein
MEAGLEALKSAMKQGFDDIKSDLRDIKDDVDALKAAENQRKGALAIMAVAAGAVGSVVTWIIGHFGG